MTDKAENTNKRVVIRKWQDSKKYWMSGREYTGVVVGKVETNSEYVISDGVIEPEGYIPDHYHKWEDQTFHVISGMLEVKIGDNQFHAGPGDSIHCPRGTSHYMKNIGDENAHLISYIFPGDWAEDFMEETSRQVKIGKPNFKLIEEKFGVIYL